MRSLNKILESAHFLTKYCFFNTAFIKSSTYFFHSNEFSLISIFSTLFPPSQKYWMDLTYYLYSMLHFWLLLNFVGAIRELFFTTLILLTLVKAEKPHFRANAEYSRKEMVFSYTILCSMEVVLFTMQCYQLLLIWNMIKIQVTPTF